MQPAPSYIGWSRVDITPPKKTLLQGQFHARMSKGVASPLTATALAIETQSADRTGDAVVWLSCDLSAEFWKAELLLKIAERCPEFDSSRLTINCTHTHNAPPMVRGWYQEPQDDPDYMNPDAYRDYLTDKLAEVVVEAWRARAPGAIRRGFGYAVVGRCRRAVYDDGIARMYGGTDDPGFLGLEACDDHAVNFLFTLDASGSLSGMIINLACPSQCDEQGEMISADFWHDVRLGIAQRYGAGVHLLPQCAPAGDASPHLMIDQKEECDLRARMGVDDKGIIARRIMAAVEEAWATASEPRSQIVLEHRVLNLKLPRLPVTEEHLRLERSIEALDEAGLKQQPWGFERRWPFGLVCDPIARHEVQKTHPLHPVECHLVRLGDVVFASNPFELFMDYGTRIRARSRALQTFSVQLSDGSGEGFYLPTERALSGGHYSALIKSNWVGPEAGRMLVEETVKNIDSMFTDETYPRTR